MPSLQYNGASLSLADSQTFHKSSEDPENCLLSFVIFKLIVFAFK